MKPILSSLFLVFSQRFDSFGNANPMTVSTKETCIYIADDGQDMVDRFLEWKHWVRIPVNLCRFQPGVCGRRGQKLQGSQVCV